MASAEWGSWEWNEAHFPPDQLDDRGDTWGIRWRGMEKMRHASYLRIIEPYVRAERPLKLLDLGCALCDFTEKAWNLNRRNEVFATDISTNAVEWGKRRFPQFHLARAGLPEIPFDEAFDFVFCLEVLCYLSPEDRRRAFEIIHARLAPGGRLLFSGVLDGGAQHHTVDEVMGLLSDGFEVEVVHFNHWAVHRRFVELPARRVAGPSERLARLLRMPKAEFESWQAEAGESRRATAVRSLRAVRPVSTLTVGGAAAAADALVGWKLPAVALHGLSKVVRGRDGADEIVVLATRR